MKISEILKKNPLFSCLDEHDLDNMAKIAVEKKFPKGNATVFNEGDHSTSLYLILEGKASAIVNDENGRQIIINQFEKDDYFGEMSFIDGEPRCATVKTNNESTRLLMISRTVFQNIVLSKPDMIIRLMKGLLKKLRDTTEALKILAFDNVYQRVVKLLKKLSKPYQDGKWIIEGKLTHQEIADMVASSREMITRIFRDLLDGGYITICKDCIIINKDLPEKW